VLILSTTLHVGNNPPLPWLTGFCYSKQRGVCLHVNFIQDKLEDAYLPQFINELGAVGFREEVHQTFFVNFIPVLRGKFPP
jgi:hypothetical protein